MARVSMEAFADKEVERVYIAGSVREARRVEEELSRHRIEFAVEIEPFVRYLLLLFPTEHRGAAFYVPGAQAAFCRRALADAGLRRGLVQPEQ